jgi:hypothetical protein
VAGGSGDETVRGVGQLSHEARVLIGTRVHGLAAQQRLSVRRLETLTGIPKSTIEDLMKGRKDPPLGMLVALVGAFGLRSIEELIAPIGTSLLRKLEAPDTVDP